MHHEQKPNCCNYSEFTLKLCSLLDELKIPKQEGIEYLTLFLANCVENTDDQLICFADVIHMLSRWVIGIQLDKKKEQSN